MNYTSLNEVQFMQGVSTGFAFFLVLIISLKITSWALGTADEATLCDVR